MNLRIISPQEKDQIIKLWEMCFDDSKEFVDFFFTNRFEAENTLAVYEDNKIVSCLQLLPYKILLRGKIVDTYYIVGVCTHPQYRNKGYVKDLLHYSLNHMNSMGVYVSILLPFQYEFYRKYGWEICYDRLRYINMSDFKYNTIYDRNDFVRIELDRDFELLDKCYKGFIKKYSGCVCRSFNDWLRIYHDYTLDEGTGYLHIKNGTPLGYIIYTKERKSLFIKELAYIEPQSKWEMLSFIRDLAKESSVGLSLNAPSDDLSFLHMTDSRGKLLKETYVMGRINNVIKGLEGITLNDSGTVRLNVKDSFYDENSTVYCLYSKSGMLQVERLEPDDVYDISLRIDTLSQILWGYITPVNAYEQGLLKVNNMDTLKVLTSMFPSQKPYIIEDY